MSRPDNRVRHLGDEAEMAESRGAAPARSIEPPSGTDIVLAMQATAGNAAVVRLLRSAAPPPPDGVAGTGLAETVRPLLGQGPAIPDPARTELESAVGGGLGGVTVHNDSTSATLAAGMSARAFTIGQDIFFGHGEFDQDTARGRAVLAHEVAHTRQAPGRPVARALATHGAALSSPTDSEEIVAHHFAEQFVAHGTEGPARPVPGAPAGPATAEVPVWRDPVGAPPPTGAADQIQTVDPEANAEQSAAEEETFDDQAQQAALAEQPSIWHDILEGASGVAYGSMQSLTPGGFAAPSPAPQSRLFEFFRGAGQVATGVAEMVAGAGGEVGGVALDATGVGAVVGVPLNIASAAVIAQGAVSTAAGVGTLVNAMSMQGGSSGGGGPRLPAKGTPQRAAIESARRSGIRAAQRRELDNIKAGGKGTSGNEVWTDAELAKIRETGQFPKDVRWHHNPTVANRPDLAGDPGVIRPIRGGVQGHLAAHGGDFRK